MGEHTAIAWTNATFNPWSGCSRVSPACDHCYAAALPSARRRHAEWGDHPRVMASDAYWRQPLAWNRKAEREGRRIRVFCGSTCDVFERSALLDGPRWKVWALMEMTPSLDWLLLTKRPDKMAEWARQYGWPSNAWAGVTVEDQQRARERIPFLLQVPARVRFLSMEPLLGPVDLTITSWVHCDYCGTYHPADLNDCPNCGNFLVQDDYEDIERISCEDIERISWVIVGGESGPHARPLHPDWVRSIRDQCAAAVVPFFFKQWGEFRLDDSHYRRLGVRQTGRVLDGRTWEETP